MPRAVSNVPRLKRKKQILKHAKGAFGARSKLWKAAKENVERGWKYAYRDRKNKKRDFRRLWIVRINAAARQHDMSYNVFINGLGKTLAGGFVDPNTGQSVPDGTAGAPTLPVWRGELQCRALGMDVDIFDDMGEPPLIVCQP